MNFNTFQIRRFSDEELANIFDNRVNQIFYPRAVIDIKPLADYWFIETTRLKARLPLPRGIDLLSFDWGLLDLIEPEYKRFAELFGSPRQILELFPWEPIDHNLYKDEPRPGPLPHPLVIQTDDDLLSPRHYMPHLSRLQTEIWYVDPITGEESERPAIWIRLSQDQTNRFEEFVQRMEGLFAELQRHLPRWEFLERALAYFMRALQAEGQDQLLWYITAMEALLGERGEGVTERLAQRISTILGSAEGDRKKIMKQFKNLYGFRCDIVHGNKLREKMLKSHLAAARSCTRKTLVWFLHYLHATQMKTDESHESLPSRDVLLTYLDLDKNTRQSFHRLMGLLPSEFPFVREWMK